jgi:hypothetical protein
MAIGVTTGPLIFAGVLLAGTLRLLGWVLIEAIVIATVLCLVPLVFGMGVLTLQRWNANGQTVASCGLLAASLATVFILSSPSFVSLVAHGGSGGPSGEAIVAALGESLAFVGIVVAVVMTPIALVEVLLRWVSGSAVPVSDGPFLVLRWVGSLLVVSAGAVVIQEEGAARLLNILLSMRM